MLQNHLSLHVNFLSFVMVIVVQTSSLIIKLFIMQIEQKRNVILTYLLSQLKANYIFFLLCLVPLIIRCFTNCLMIFPTKKNFYVNCS